MPLPRYHSSRSKSRSPNPAFASTLSPGRFFPPSHYAAAAGISYPGSPRYGEPSKVTSPLDTASERSKLTQGSSSVFPASTESEDMTDSSFEYKSVLNPLVNGGAERASSKRASLREKRQSHIAELEAQLLPSLRDTIDRMTRPPSRATPSPFSGVSRQLSNKSSFAPTQTPELPSTYNASPRGWGSHIVPPEAICSFSDNSFSTTSGYSDSSSSERPSSPSANVNAPTPKIRQQSNFGLKTSLRLPTSKASSGPPSSSERSASPGMSLKSVRNILTKKQSQPTASADKEPSRKPILKKNANVNPSQAFSPGNSHAAWKSTDHATKPSSIPRPANKPPRSPWRENFQTDDSDFEFRYELDSRDRRKLVVANAEVFASSSSESEAETPQQFSAHGFAAHAPQQTLGHGDDFSTRVGLGVRLDTKSLRKATNSRLWAAGEGDHFPGARLSPLTGKSYPSQFQDIDSEHRRRRAALLGIVSELQSEFSALRPGETDESEYHGEQGVAFSDSTDFAPEIPSPKPSDGMAAPEIRNDSWSIRHPNFKLSSHANRPLSRSSQHLQVEQSYSSPRASPNSGGQYRKITSKSPTMTETSDVSFPKSLRRHSVYPPRSPSPNPVENGRTMQTMPIWRQEARQTNNAVTDALTIAQRSYASAARQRRAFGIPPSDSDQIYDRTSQPRASQNLTHSESGMSSIGSISWKNEAHELSVGAETLFRKLSGSAMHTADSNGYENARKSVRMSVISQSSSAPSVYDDFENDIGGPARDRYSAEQLQANESTMTLGATGHKNERQELITELLETEEIFVHRLQAFVAVFVLPLRIQNAKTWISGVPSDVARFFDWLEDILNLHTEMLASLQADAIADRFAEVLRPFIPRLEIYQPYLVKLDDIASTLDNLTSDTESDLAAFILMQEQNPECDGWNLMQFLVEPARRLSYYPVVSQKLLSCTPKGRSDYLATFALLHATKLMIRVMTEVKAREDEYELIKSFLCRIHGLPASVQLAMRERRLLYQGSVKLDRIASRGQEQDEAEDETEEIHRDPQRPSRPFSNLSKRHSRLAEAVQDWDARRARMGSACSSSTGESLLSLRTLSSGKSNFLSSDVQSIRRSMFRDRLLAQAPSGPAAANGHVYDASQVIQVFIFMDIVLLATPIVESNVHEWRLLDGIGILRILGVTQLEQDSRDPIHVIVDAVPVDAANLELEVDSQSGPVTVLHLSIPSQTAPKADAQDQGKADTCLAALHRCFRYTMASVSLSSHTWGHGPNSDLAQDTRQTVFCQLASGLPLPKSPSMQAVDHHEGQNKDAATEEREERGWWSLRFQQVFRELQRQDMVSISLGYL